MMRTRIRFLGVLLLTVVFLAGCRLFPSRKKPATPPPPSGKKGDASGVAVDIKEQIDKQPSSASVAEAEVIKALREVRIEVRAEGKPEYLVMGEAEATSAGKSEIYAMEMSVYSAVVSLRVIDKRTGKILEAASATVRKMAAGKQTAARGALREAAQRAMRKIILAVPRPMPTPKPVAKPKPKAKPATKVKPESEPEPVAKPTMEKDRKERERANRKMMRR